MSRRVATGKTRLFPMPYRMKDTSMMGYDVLYAARMMPSRRIMIPVWSRRFGGYRTVMMPMMRLPIVAMMLNAVLSCPSWVMGVFRAVLISGMSRLSATSWGPVLAVLSARLRVIHLVSL